MMEGDDDDENMNERDSNMVIVFRKYFLKFSFMYIENNNKDVEGFKNISFISLYIYIIQKLNRSDTITPPVDISSTSSMLDSSRHVCDETISSDHPISTSTLEGIYLREGKMLKYIDVFIISYITSSLEDIYLYIYVRTKDV